MNDPINADQLDDDANDETEQPEAPQRRGASVRPAAADGLAADRDGGIGTHGTSKIR